jgi:4-cresol dehydrogenase (hydroxylating)
MDATGSSPECSIIGNTMERGFGHTPFGDHASHVCAFEVVLPTGDVIETGSSRFRGSLTGPVVRWGVGPNPDGLFSQSNLGIVTRMTVWLMPAPQAFEAFFYRCEDTAGLPALIDALQALRLQEMLRSAIHIANDYRVLAGTQQYPWTEAKERTPLPPELLASLQKRLNFGYWNASGALYGTPRQIADGKAALKRQLGGLSGTLKFLKPSTLALAKRFSKPFRLFTGWDLSRTVSLVEPVLGLMQGIPTDRTLSSAYWRKRFPIPDDPHPDRDRCGLLWYSPTAPADGATVEKLTATVSRIFLKHGFEPAISLTMISPRAVFCIASLAYDRDVPGQDEAARDCYNELTAECHSEGFFPYRLGIQSPELPVDDAYRRFAASLKSALDPNQILAPGRYEDR